MKLLIITQKVDKDDDLLGFFHQWVAKIAPYTEHTYVIANGAGEMSLPSNVTVYSLGKEKGRTTWLKFVYLSYYLLKTLPKVDGIFAHMCPEYILASYPVNFFFRRPIVMWYAHVRVSRLAKWASTKVYKILSPSGESFISDTDKLIATGHGIDTSLFKPATELRRKHEGTTVLSISRISYVKDIDTLIEAARVLDARGAKDIHIRIVGSPGRSEDVQYLKDLKEKVKRYDIESYITWAPAVSNLKAILCYQNADIFVRMQRGGGYGKTELEAMAVGVPAITCTPVYQDKLGEFAHELYFEDGNAEELAERILSVSKWDDAKRQKYATVARSIVVNGHNLDILAKRIVDAFPQ